MPIDEEDFERLYHAVFGNGKTGLVEEVRTMRRSLYQNPDTGEPGLVRDVGDIKRLLVQVRGSWWLIGALLVLIEFLRAIGVLGR